MTLELRGKMSGENAGVIAAGAALPDGEAAVVAAAKRGDAQAFEKLVERYEGRIFRLAQNIMQNREDAEDVSQEAFVQAFQHLDKFQGDSRFSTWLTRIAINQALMKLRKKRRVKEFSLDEPVEEDLPVPVQLVDWGPTPEQRYSQREMQRILSEAIAGLRPMFRAVFQLRDIEEFSTEETAQALGLSIPAVKARAVRARLQLREALDRHFRRPEMMQSAGDEARQGTMVQ
ncbi:MAG: sigma-70 family RNA polymerase sigma factor [Candidatus Acidiferrales bacterium]